MGFYPRHKESLCPRVYGPENKPQNYGPVNKPRSHDKPQSTASASPSAFSPDTKKDSFSRKDQKPVWKPVSLASANQSSAVASSLALVVHPATKPCPEPSPPVTKEASMDLVLVDKSFSPVQKPLHQKLSKPHSVKPTQTSNPFDVLLEDHLAITLSGRPAHFTDHDLPSNDSKKKRKVSSSSVSVSRDDPPPLGVMHHTT
ncbi:unnamed protein product [Microthlaspi erraticum]|uniref:Uncharacterized protein n=1 Tax=Microthlaspi erraticum TaxID=1685480 RepID=A0A6D2HW61_9BRAS|nr:unnamed protein product [Microthlaspi erraticum]